MLYLYDMPRIARAGDVLNLTTLQMSAEGENVRRTISSHFVLKFVTLVKLYDVLYTNFT